MNARIKSVASRVASLGSATTSVALSSILAFPILINLLGLTEWGKLAFAQALGLIVATVANWGYQNYGQKLVAGMTKSNQISILFQAAQIRFFATATIFVACCLFLAIAMPEDALALCAGAAGYFINGLSNIWYFQGTDQTRKAVVLEAIPKILSMWLAIFALLMQGSLLAFCLVFFAISFFGSIFALLKLIGLTLTSKAARTCFQSVHTMSRSWMGAAASAVSLVYMTIPIVVVGILAPAALPMYALLERLIRFTSLGLSPVTASIQSWVLIDQATQKLEVTIKKIAVVLLVYTIGAAMGFGFLLSGLGYLLPRSDAAIPTVLALLASVTLAASLSTQVLGPAFLASQTNLKFQLTSASAGALSWLAMGPVGILLLQGFGAQLALAFAEVMVLLIQATRVASIRRKAVRQKGKRVE